MLDNNTFGKAPAQIILCKILNELNNKVLTKKVSNTYINFSTVMIKLRRVKDRRYRREFCSLWLKKIIEDIKKRNFPNIVETHLLASLHTTYTCSRCKRVWMA